MSRKFKINKVFEEGDIMNYSKKNWIVYTQYKRKAKKNILDYLIINLKKYRHNFIEAILLIYYNYHLQAYTKYSSIIQFTIIKIKSMIQNL